MRLKKNCDEKVKSPCPRNGEHGLNAVAAKIYRETLKSVEKELRFLKGTPLKDVEKVFKKRREEDRQTLKQDLRAIKRIRDKKWQTLERLLQWNPPEQDLITRKKSIVTLETQLRELDQEIKTKELCLGDIGRIKVDSSFIAREIEELEVLKNVLLEATSPELNN